MTHLILTIILLSRHHYCYFTDKKAKEREAQQLAQGNTASKSRAGFGTQGTWLESLNQGGPALTAAALSLVSGSRPGDPLSPSSWSNFKTPPPRGSATTHCCICLRVRPARPLRNSSHSQWVARVRRARFPHPQPVPHSRKQYAEPPASRPMLRIGMRGQGGAGWWGRDAEGSGTPVLKQLGGWASPQVSVWLSEGGKEGSWLPPSWGSPQPLPPAPFPRPPSEQRGAQRMGGLAAPDFYSSLGPPPSPCLPPLSRRCPPFPPG